MKDLGIILVLIGVLCLVVYVVALPVNWLLLVSLIVEIAGVIVYILLNHLLK